MARSTFDPFSRDQQRWPHRILVVDKFRNTIRKCAVPAGSDLRAVFDQELQRWAAEGWTIEKPYKASCFINRGAARYLVTLSTALA